jgi:hypothetical protein
MLLRHGQVAVIELWLGKGQCEAIIGVPVSVAGVLAARFK